MEHNEQRKSPLSSKEKIRILSAALAGLAAGGVLGIIAYYQQWLG